jgi:hypothetical protein
VKLLKAGERLHRLPECSRFLVFEVANCDLKASASSFVIRKALHKKSNRVRF